MFQVRVDDRWQWCIQSSTIYTINSTYHFLSSSEHVTTTDSLHNIWQKAVSLKINLFVWRLLQNHIPTFDNLIISNAVTVWVVGVLMKILIIYFHYNLFRTIWSLIFNWPGYVTVNYSHISNLLVQFGQEVQSVIDQQWIFYIWLACILMI